MGKKVEMIGRRFGRWIARVEITITVKGGDAG